MVRSPRQQWLRLVRVLYGEVDWDEMPRIMWLSALLCAIIGGFWLLDSLKDTVLATTVGLAYQPRAKVASVCVTLVVVSAYNALIDRVSKPSLFYAVGTTYFFVFVGIGGCLAHKTIGMENTTPDPRRVVGWLTYFAIESYGSLAVALFWAFTNASIDLESAKSSYGLIVAFAQLGAIFGSTLATKAQALHVSFLFVIGGSSCLLVCAMVRGYEVLFYREASSEKHGITVVAEISTTPSHGDSSSTSPTTRTRPRLFDGFGLVTRYPYVTSLLAISTLYEIVLTVLDFEMKIMGRARYGGDARGAEQFAELMGHFGQTVNTISFVFSLCGFSYVVRSLGLPTTLLVFPALLIVATLVAYASPGLWTLFVTTAILKALTYALNEPALEMLYVPTSDDIKFKAKAWIDVVGARSAKAAGSAINDFVQSSSYLRENLPQYGNVPALLVSIVLLAVSAHVGSKFETLVEDGLVVGEDDFDDFDDLGGLLDDDQEDLLSPNSRQWRRHRRRSEHADRLGAYELVRSRAFSARSEEDDDAKTIFGAIAREESR